jgi:hypothetical protein
MEQHEVLRSGTVVPIDRKTRAAVQGSQLRTALEQARRAIALEDDDAWRARLTTAAATLAEAEQRANRTWADLREAEARVASSALEG